jgi:hypothetical protein
LWKGWKNVEGRQTVTRLEEPKIETCAAIPKKRILDWEQTTENRVVAAVTDVGSWSSAGVTVIIEKEEEGRG